MTTEELSRLPSMDQVQLQRVWICVNALAEEVKSLWLSARTKDAQDDALALAEWVDSMRSDIACVRDRYRVRP